MTSKRRFYGKKVCSSSFVVDSVRSLCLHALMTHADVVKLIQAKIEKAGSLRKQALRWKISAPYLSDVMLGRRQPGPAILRRLGLTVRKVVTRTYDRA